MPIYTKTGDQGSTSIFGGKKVPKYDIQVEAYGSLDEANSFIGFAMQEIPVQDTRELLTSVQWDLYAIMAYLSGAELKKAEVKKRLPLMEKEIDNLEKYLPKLVRFILPQGSEATVRLHIARSVVRSCERRVIEYIDHKEKRTKDDETVIQYLNRLSDLLFMLARSYSSEEKVT